ncbi:hypothetical protein MMC11_004979 [Xylographa trunciseda]|nr:hypothetical protein [Xylographa trunciseda]
MQHLYFSATVPGPDALFKPIITVSRSPLAECDFIYHKSNSTYFTDIDINRFHLLACICREGIVKLRNTPKTFAPADSPVAPGKFMLGLGSVSRNFHREIKPYVSHEIRSRILAWDEKWIYSVTHFVRKGARMSKTQDKGKQETDSEMNLRPEDIYASSVSKFIFKLGRVRVHPEVFLAASGLLPPKPGGWFTLSKKKGNDPGSMNGKLGSSFPQDTRADSGCSWDWQRVDQQKERDLVYARHFAAMEGLRNDFNGTEENHLGVYQDLS